MKRQDIGWLLAAVGSVVVAWVMIRRREMVPSTIPELEEDRIVLSMGNFVREGFDSRGEDGSAAQERLTRKVGRNRKISVYGKLYGPLEPELIGQQVEVEERDDRFIVWAGEAEVGNFERQS
jgi:hypothetical protein